MSANRNSLPKNLHIVQTAARRIFGLLCYAAAARPYTRTEAQDSASRLPSSHLRREPRRWLYVSAQKCRESQLRFAVPARIALQGGERASAVANIRDLSASEP